MSRKTSTLTLLLLIIALVLIPNVYAEYPIENIVVVKDLPSSMVAGSSYEMIITFDNVAEETITFVVKITVTSDEAIGEDEIFIDGIKLNGVDLIDLPIGDFTTVEGSVSFSSNNELRIVIRTAINLMPGTYTFEVELLGEEIEPEPEPEPYRPSRPIPNKLPVADAGKNQRVYVGEYVKFSGVNSTDPDGTILSYQWDFGDGAEASGVNASHRYLMEDNYTVTLTVVDDRYGEDTDNCTITVIEHAITPPPLPPYLDNLNITPAQLELGDNVTISFNIMNFDSQHITYGVDIYVEDVNVTRIWVELGGYEFKTVSHTITPDTVGIYSVAVHGMTGSFTVEAPEIPLRPAEFVVSDLIITPEEVEPGDEVTISVLVTNIGEETGDYTITLDLPAGPFLRIQETVSLEGGESKRVEFEVSRDIEGIYAVEVDGLTGNFTVKAPPRPAEFEATGLEITPEEVEEGEEVTITLKVSNIGDEEGTHTVELRIDGSLEESETVTLPGGGTEEVSFEVTRGEGSYQVEADGLTGEFTVTAPPGPPLTPGYISGIVILIVVAAVVIIYLFMERRGPFRLPSAGTAQS